MPRMDTDFYDALLALNVPPEHARAASIALVRRVDEAYALRREQDRRTRAMLGRWARKDKHEVSRERERRRRGCC